MIVTKELMRMNFDDGYCNIVVTWDSAAQVEGEWDYVGKIISIVATNTSPTQTIYAAYRRGNGSVVATRSLPPAVPPNVSTETYTGGGNIRNVEDIPNIAIFT